MDITQDPDFRSRMNELLRGEPFRLSAKQIGEVWGVFMLGLKNREANPDLPSGNDLGRFWDHVDHACSHHEFLGGRVEAESGLPHPAHVIARLMLALASVADGWTR